MWCVQCSRCIHDGMAVHGRLTLCVIHDPRGLHKMVLSVVLEFLAIDFALARGCLWCRMGAHFSGWPEWVADVIVACLLGEIGLMFLFASCSLCQNLHIHRCLKTIILL